MAGPSTKVLLRVSVSLQEQWCARLRARMIPELCVYVCVALLAWTVTRYQIPDSYIPACVTATHAALARARYPACVKKPATIGRSAAVAREVTQGPT